VEGTTRTPLLPFSQPVSEQGGFLPPPRFMWFPPPIPSAPASLRQTRSSSPLSIRNFGSLRASPFFTLPTFRSFPDGEGTPFRRIVSDPGRHPVPPLRDVPRSSSFVPHLFCGDEVGGSPAARLRPSSSRQETFLEEPLGTPIFNVFPFPNELVAFPDLLLE